ncbi:helix-turn-helix domain-containing protein [Sandaracinobacteroides hominis]|uniref:helix-turn-helix domain-containing protein n=1 Tax=Sandaracinobacteroides hominis TaxID=2780086 RepID=UPI0018F4235C|nr:helix-turn-helix domain-containing protein [Sandaracinobacteroides hominis]
MSMIAVAWASEAQPGSASMKLVLWALADNHRKESGLAFPSLATLVDFTGLNRKTVIACLDRLEADGWIADSGIRKGATGQVKAYRLFGGGPAKTEESQKRNGSEKSRKESQKRDTEPFSEPTTPLTPKAPQLPRRRKRRAEVAAQEPEPIDPTAPGESDEADELRRRWCEAMGQRAYAALFRNPVWRTSVTFTGSEVLIQTANVELFRSLLNRKLELIPAVRAVCPGAELRVPPPQAVPAASAANAIRGEREARAMGNAGGRR